MLETDEIRLAEVQTIRLCILRLLHTTNKIGANERTILTALNSSGFCVLKHEVRKYFEYLEALETIEIIDKERATWEIKILPYGIDIVEFAVKSPAGIAKG